MDVDFGEIFRLSFRWLKLRESWKYAFLVWGTGLLSLVFAGVLALVMFPQFFTAILSGNTGYLTQFFLSLAANPGELIGFLFYIVIFVVVISVFSFFVSSIAYAFSLCFGLRSNGFKTIELTANKYFSFIGLLIAEYLAAMFYSFNKTARLIQWVAFALFAGCTGLFLAMLFIASSGAIDGYGILMLLCLLLGVPAFIAWIAIMVYNSLMMALSQPVFFSEEIGVIDSLKKSWKLMKGNVWSLIIASIIIGLASLLVISISQVVLTVVLTLPLGMLLPWLTSLKLTADFASNIAGFILGPVSVFINVFFISAFYATISHRPIPGIK